MRIILDTNVFISGIFFTGPPSQILKAWRDGKVQVLVSPSILDEKDRFGVKATFYILRIFGENFDVIHKKIGPAPAGQKIRHISLNDRMSLKYGKYPSQIFHSCVT
jgi:hypothetical protein